MADPAIAKITYFARFSTKPQTEAQLPSVERVLSNNSSSKLVSLFGIDTPERVANSIAANSHLLNALINIVPFAKSEFGFLNGVTEEFLHQLTKNPDLYKIPALKKLSLLILQCNQVVIHDVVEDDILINPPLNTFQNYGRAFPGASSEASRAKTLYHDWHVARGQLEDVMLSLGLIQDRLYTIHQPFEYKPGSQFPAIMVCKAEELRITDRAGKSYLFGRVAPHCGTPGAEPEKFRLIEIRTAEEKPIENSPLIDHVFAVVPNGSRFTHETRIPLIDTLKASKSRELTIDNGFFQFHCLDVSRINSDKDFFLNPQHVVVIPQTIEEIPAWRATTTRIQQAKDELTTLLKITHDKNLKISHGEHTAFIQGGKQQPLQFAVCHIDDKVTHWYSLMPNGLHRHHICPGQPGTMPLTSIDLHPLAEHQDCAMVLEQVLNMAKNSRLMK
jgi:hypothetical protein